MFLEIVLDSSSAVAAKIVKSISPPPLDVSKLCVSKKTEIPSSFNSRMYLRASTVLRANLANDLTRILSIYLLYNPPSFA